MHDAVELQPHRYSETQPSLQRTPHELSTDSYCKIASYTSSHSQKKDALALAGDIEMNLSAREEGIIQSGSKI